MTPAQRDSALRDSDRGLMVTLVTPSWSECRPCLSLPVSTSSLQAGPSPSPFIPLNPSVRPPAAGVPPPRTGHGARTDEAQELGSSVRHGRGLPRALGGLLLLPDPRLRGCRGSPEPRDPPHAGGTDTHPASGAAPAPVAPRHPRVPALPDRPRCPPTLPRPPGNARAPPLKGAAPRRGQKGTNRCKIDPVFYLGRGGGCGSAPQGSSTPIPQQCDPMVPSSVCVCVYVQGGLWLKDGALERSPFPGGSTVSPPPLAGSIPAPTKEMHNTGGLRGGG